MHVKKHFSLALFILLTTTLHAQDVQDLNALKTKLSLTPVGFQNFLDTKFKTIENMILNEPGIYNELWSRVDNSFRQKNDRFLFKNLKLEFKSFQSTDSNKTSLGFSYQWNYDINKNKNTDYQRTEFLAKINAQGNIAFNKNLNPADFQSAKLEMGSSGFWGGTVRKLDADFTKQVINPINQKLAAITDSAELANSSLWNDITRMMGITNQYHYDFAATGGWEGSQDFSRSQLTYGAQLRFAAKAYSDRNPLAQFNVLDYPFALIRYVTGSDKSLNPYGAALPIITVGVDMVNPLTDTLRKSITGNTNAYSRFRWEAGFRTLIANFKNAPLHFNAAYRNFYEINPSAAVRLAGLNNFSYFTCSVTSSDTYFFSYSYGKLPFDRIDNAVYELGVKFKL